MRLLGKILNRFNGLRYGQEYLCLAKDGEHSILHVYLVSDGRVLKDITKLHCFVGYSPLVFAISSFFIPSDNNGMIELIFTVDTLEENAFFDKKDAVARLYLKKINVPLKEMQVFFYEGIKGKHHFITAFNQQVISISNNLNGRKPGNVFLEGNLYKQVQIAYSIPRKISLITVGKDDRFNHFPTDLHGRVDNYYIISLRHEGKACRQVQDFRTIVLSDILPSAYKRVYALGKNHMQELKQAGDLNFSERRSLNFGLPLPEDLVEYRELELTDSFTHGIHRIFLFSVLHQEKVLPGQPVLQHVHNCFATWQFNSGQPGNYLLR